MNLTSPPPPPRTGSPGPARQAKPESPTRRALRHFRDRMLAGVAVVAPVWVTVVAVAFLFRIARSGSLWLITGALSSPIGAPLLAMLGTDTASWKASGLDALPVHGEWLVSLLAILLTVATVYGAGLFSMFVVGRRAIRLVERVVEQVPLVATVYGASKQVVDSITNDENQPFHEVVLIGFPTTDVRSIGFVTKRWTTPDGQPYAAVFVPTTPNPTSGFLLVVNPAAIQNIPMSVDEAVAVVMSGGVLLKELQQVPVPRSA
ncbi:MAG: DUF502 domain-containing protein [Myxococcota bacterium]